ncbi:MAG: alpha/beta fold hydrolase [Chloroflexi bacterium]|nr:alpha/beta fold hydrolase [Chloroflexota bacterium]
MRRWLLLALFWLLVGCRPTAVSPTPTALPVQPVLRATPVIGTTTPPPTTAFQSTPTVTLATMTAVPAIVAPTSTPNPTITPDPYADLTIDALAARPYGGGLLEIEDTLEQNDDFARYLITYPSDGLTIYGYMNVPNQGSRFPVVLMLHGYVDPAAYETVAYTRRYADDLARAGYLVIHPNLRNYPPSDSGPDPFRIGYAIDVLNLIAIIRQQSQDPLGVLRRANADEMHLWGHSMGGGVALRVITVNNAAYIQTAVLYGSMSGDEWQNYEQIRQWTNGRRGEFELAASPETLAAISPINHLERINTAVAIHHSYADETVPVGWSEALCAQLEALNKPVECFFYEGAPHTFRGLADWQLMERVRLFYVGRP